MTVLGSLMKGHLNPQTGLLLYPFRRREKKFCLYSKRRRHKKRERRSSQSLFWIHYLLSWNLHTWKCLVVISSSLTVLQEDCLLEVLKKCKKAIGWQISDLKGINPLVCTHHIYMKEEAKPVHKAQRMLNPHMQRVMRAEVLKLLQAGIIYPISDSLWVSPT